MSGTRIGNGMKSSSVETPTAFLGNGRGTKTSGGPSGSQSKRSPDRFWTSGGIASFRTRPTRTRYRLRCRRERTFCSVEGTSSIE
jgi:hypothetical protein